MNSVALAIKITTDAKGAAAGIDGVTQSTSKMGKAGALAGKALAVGLGVAVVAAGKAAAAAAEDETAQVKLAGALKNATGARESDIASVESWITAQGKALGVADSELRPSLEALVSATKDVAKAQDLATIAMDIAARKGESVEAVSKKLAKAYATGNVAALAKYGVATKDAEGKTRSLGDVQADLAKLYKGGAADAADTMAGKQKKLSVAVDELQEKYGAKLIPVLMTLAAVGMTVVDWIDRNERAAAVIVGTIGSLLAITFAVSKAMQVWAAVTKVAAAAQLALNLVMAANPVVLVVLAVIALVAALVLAYKKSETFRNIVNAVFGAIAKTVSTVVEFIKANWAKLLVFLTGPIGAAVVLIVKNWDRIQAGAASVVKWVKDKWGDLTGMLSGPVEAAKNAISGAFDAVLNKVQSVINTVQALYDKLVALKNAATGANTRGPTNTQDDLDRLSSGRAGRGNVTVNLTVNGYVGDRIQLVRQIRDDLGADMRRLTRA